MSRIGKKPIELGSQAQCEIKGREVLIKGPKGEILQILPAGISAQEKDGFINVFISGNEKTCLALWGLSRSLLQNHVQGVCQGFEKKLEMKGVGYKSSIEEGGKVLRLDVGFSHPVKMEIPQGIAVEISKEFITISGINKEKVGQFAAQIRKTKPPEPYKGKGIRYFGEKVRRKEGKRVASTK